MALITLFFAAGIEPRAQATPVRVGETFEVWAKLAALGLSRRRRGRSAPHVALAAVACVFALALGGCSGGQEDTTGEGGAAPDGGSPCTPRDAQPAVGPSGYPLDGWTWTRHGVVLADPAAAELDGYLAPAVAVAGDTLHLWVTRKQGLVHRIWHATSTDGRVFSDPVPTVGLAGEDIIAYPSVVVDGARFLMWYGSGSFDHAESGDGVNWTMVAENVLGPGPSGAFDSLTVAYPTVMGTAPAYTMFYTGFDGQRFAIGGAVSQDGVLWDRPVSSPALEPGGASDFDNTSVAQPCAVDDHGVLLWYGGYDTSVADPGPYRIGLAFKDAINPFERRGVTLDLAPSGVEAYSTRDPAVTRWLGRWWLLYVGMGDDRRYRILSASSTTCGD